MAHASSFSQTEAHAHRANGLSTIAAKPSKTGVPIMPIVQMAVVSMENALPINATTATSVHATMDVAATKSAMAAFGVPAHKQSQRSAATDETMTVTNL